MNWELRKENCGFRVLYHKQKTNKYTNFCKIMFMNPEEFQMGGGGGGGYIVATWTAFLSIPIRHALFWIKTSEVMKKI